MKKLILSGLMLLASTGVAGADIRITEVMSSSGTGGTNDWFEVRNFGSSAISLAGWRMDDNSFNVANSVELLGIGSIAAGESVVFIENTGVGATTINNFKTFWFGGNAPSGFQVGFYNGSGAGVSFGSGGDGVALFDGPGPGGAERFRVTFGTATTGRSFDNHLGNSGLISTVSNVGDNGAFLSANSLGNIGSPSAVPEPASMLLLGVAGIGGLAFRQFRRKTNKNEAAAS
jgi:hypothetical protein